MRNGLVPMVTAGPEAIRASEVAREIVARHSEAPYRWENAPPGSKHIFAFGAVETPAQAAAVEVLAYQIPNNKRGVFRWLLVEYTGGSYNPGDFTWSMTVNLPVGSTIGEGVTVKDYVNVPFNMGSRAGGPWPMNSGELSVFESRDIIRIQATNVQLGVGTPNFFVAALIGYEWPTA